MGERAPGDVITSQQFHKMDTINNASSSSMVTSFGGKEEEVK